MRRILPWIGLLAVVVMGIGFAAVNSGQRVRIDLGIVTLYQIPVTFVAFGGMVAGMVVVLLAGVRTDLKVRELLREKALPENPLRPALPLTSNLSTHDPEELEPDEPRAPVIPETSEPPSL